MNNDFPAHFAEVFASLDRNNLHRLDEIYHPVMHFTDPLHDVQGLHAMRHYCEQLYANVSAISFEFHACQTLTEGEAFLRWTMTYQHPRLKSGQPIAVEGCSYICFHGRRVSRHIDYYDAGALLYEHIPVLGRVIHWLKRRLA